MICKSNSAKENLNSNWITLYKYTILQSFIQYHELRAVWNIGIQ